MTDLTKGIIEIDGFTITPETTLEQFEGYFGNKVSKTINRFDSTIVRFEQQIYEQYHSMNFVNYLVLFRNGIIEKLELESDLQPYAIDAYGQKTYSPENEDACYNKMVEWGSEVLGKPNYDRWGCWNYAWGCLKTSTGSSSNSFFVEYGRNYSL